MEPGGWSFILQRFNQTEIGLKLLYLSGITAAISSGFNQTEIGLKQPNHEPPVAENLRFNQTEIGLKQLCQN